MKLANGQGAGQGSAQTREEAHAALADRFAGGGWTPAGIRAAEHAFSPESPVADAMEASSRQAEADSPEAGG
jgi:hypothetical protein